MPSIQVGNGRMRYSAGFDFRPQLYEENWVPRAYAPFQCDSALAAVTLAPGASRSVSIPFSEMLGELPPALHRFVIVVNGRAMNCAVQVMSRWLSRLERVRDTPAEIDFHLATLRDTTQNPEGALMLLNRKRSETVRIVPELMALCDSLKVPTRVQVMQLVSTLPIDADARLDFLLERIDDPDPRVRATACSGIGIVMRAGLSNDRRVEAGNVLIRLLGDENPGVRGAAITAVNNARVLGSVPVLESILKFDADPGNRGSARRAINVLEGRSPCNDPPIRAD